MLSFNPINPIDQMGFIFYTNTKKREWDRNRSFVRIRFRRPTSAQLSRAVKADEISVVEPTQPLRLARQSKDN